MEKPKIIACIIAKNEEETLANCVASIKGVDAIYIVDTGSEDKTVEIAKTLTDNVYTDYTWNDNFAEARNHVLSKVKEDNAYILSIDCDEIVKDFSKVREAVDKAYERGDVSINCKLFAENNNQMHWFPRLFKKTPQVWWEGAVHNHISARATLDSDVEIVYGYSPAHYKDPDRAMRILKKEVDRTGNAREMYYLGREYWYRRMYPECVEIMGAYVQKAHFLSEKADAFLIMARSYWAMGMGNDARDACAQCLIINPHFKEAVIFMSILAGRGTGNPEWEKKADFWEKASLLSDNTNVLFVRD